VFNTCEPFDEITDKLWNAKSWQESIGSPENLWSVLVYFYEGIEDVRALLRDRPPAINPLIISSTCSPLGPIH
jgi:hypothetical protein